MVIVVLGLYYISKLDIIEQNKTEPVLLDSSRLKSELVQKKGNSVRGIDISLVKKPSVEMMAKAKGVYTSTCATCHGALGLGDGQAGAVLQLKPRNFQNNDGWKNGRQLSGIFKTIQEGIPGTGMTGYDYLENDVKVSLAHLVREFAKDAPVITDEELADMDTKYSLTQDKVTSNQIPVKKALELIVAESNDFQKSLIMNSESVKADQSEAAGILREHTNCLEKVFAMLKKNEDWKQSTEMFTKIVFFGAPANGFCPSIADLDREKLTSIHEYLKSKI